jgi:putative DNA primase/helicase
VSGKIFLRSPDRLANRPSSPVLVVEGEKTADAAGRLFPDYVATTSPAGARAAHKANFAPLMGRMVVIWPDADEAGAKYASVFAEGAKAAGAAQVRIVRLPGWLHEGWDLADPFPAGWSVDQLKALLNQAAHQSIYDDTELDRLAQLSVLQYERERAPAAKLLGLRKEMLDKEVYARRPKSRDPGKSGQGRTLHIESPDPWPEPVDGAALLSGITESIRKHVVLQPEAADAVALWCLFTHAFDAAQHSPRLAITSPEKGCGKTTLLAILRHLVNRPLGTENITPAVMFRVVEMARPTLLVDEADTFVGKEELRGVIDSGHYRNGEVWRTVGDNHDPRSFSTFSPLAIARIGKLHSTIADRSISISLRRRRREEPVERFRDDRAEALEILARQGARWALDHLAELRATDPEVPPVLYNRAADNWRALLAIADAVGGEWPDRARQAALAISHASDATDSESNGVMMLEDMRSLFETRRKDRLSSNDLVAALSEREDRPWPEFKGGKPITARQIARLLAPFDIAPTNIKIEGQVAKGYKREDCQDAFDRHLAPVQYTTPLPP